MMSNSWRVLKRLASGPWKSFAVFSLYALVALAANWPSWPGDPSRTRAVNNFFVVGSSDVDVQTWFLGWTAHALVHGVNPFYTSAFNYPWGANLVQNTSMPLLGALVTPLTLWVSPIASMNLLTWLAFPLSAFSAYFVIRRFVKWDLAALIGGAIYGFSPWIVTQNLYHLNLCFVPLPPVILLSAYEILRPDQPHRSRWGAILATTVIGQFFISTEILALTLIMVVFGSFIVALRSPKQIWPAIHRSYRAIGLSVAGAAVALAYPIYILFAGPYRFAGTPNPGGLGADLLSSVLPTSLERLSMGRLGRIGSTLTFFNGSENGGYVGVPLIALLLLIIIECWRRRWVRFSAAMALFAYILSLGNTLIINNRSTGIPLPFNLVGSKNIFNAFVQIRFGLFVPLFAGAIVALGLDE